MAESLSSPEVKIPGRSKNPAFADAPRTDEAGNFHFSDMRPPAAGVFRIAPDGTKSRLSEEGVSGMKFGPDSRLYACQGAKKRVIAIDPATGAIAVLASDVQLSGPGRGYVYVTNGNAVFRRKVQAVGNTNARLAATP